MLRAVLILILSICNSVVYSQDYFLKIIPFNNDSAQPNASILFEYGDKYYIGALSGTNLTTLSTLIGVSKQGNDIMHKDLLEYGISLSPDVIIEDELYLSGKDRSIDNDLTLMSFNDQLDEIDSYRYQNDRDWSFPTGLLSIGDHLYLSSISEYDNDNQRIANIRKIDKAGKEIWNKNFGEGEHHNLFWEMTASLDGNILVSTEVHELGSYQHVIKIDTSGQEIWRYIAPEELFLGQGNYKIAPLKDGNIVVNTSNNRNFEPGYGSDGLYPFPPRLIWIDHNGQEIRDTLFNSTFQNFLYIRDIQEGHGDYFFGYGDYRDPVTEQNFAWLFKMSSDGEMIWNKQYQHPDLTDHFQSVQDIVEEDSGDIVTLIRGTKTGEQSKIILMKVDENGCFGTEICDQMPTLTSVTEPMIYSKLELFPNPVVDQLYIRAEETGVVEILDLNGKVLLGIENIKIGTVSISVSNLETGTYLCRYTAKKKSYIAKFLKSR